MSKQSGHEQPLQEQKAALDISTMIKDWSRGERVQLSRNLIRKKSFVRFLAVNLWCYQKKRLFGLLGNFFSAQVMISLDVAPNEPNEL